MMTWWVLSRSCQTGSAMAAVGRLLYESGKQRDERLDPANFHLSRGWSFTRSARKVR